jgi:hypothetical protein
LIDFQPTISLAELQLSYTRGDLIEAIHEMIDTIRGLIAQAKDSYVTFLPNDPDAYDPYASSEAEAKMAWTLGHVIAHLTATGEETAGIGSILARGIPVDWRARYEVPWRSIQTITQLIQRLEESRRIRVAYLNAWPDEPHLDVTYTRGARSSELNAVGYTLRGLKHDTEHLGQIREIMRQAQEALG